LEIRADSDATFLAGPGEDQAALHGVLNRVRDLNLTLPSVELLELDQPEK
jgi:hypothetical protein